MQQQKIAVLGGTGKAGKFLVQQLINQGFSIRLLLRDPERLDIKSPLVEIIKGDARSYEDIRSLIKGCGALISTLGQPRAEAPIFSEATTHIIRAMSEQNISRYILISGLNVDTPSDNKGEKTSLATEWMKTNYPQSTADRQKEWTILCGSETNWTMIRLPLIELTNQTNPIKISEEDCPGDKISATDLANFLIGQLSDKKYLKKSPFIASA